MKEIVRYKCSFCNKLAARPETIVKHELECVKNPGAKNCYICEKAVQGGYCDTRNGGSVWNDEIPFCSYHEMPLSDLRDEGITALNCESFVRSDKMYYERQEEE